VSGQAPAKEVIAILDVGKTHTKLAIVDAMTGTTLRDYERPSVSLSSPLGSQLDVHGIEKWLIDRFALTPEASRLRAIVPIAHGAAAVLLDRAGAVLAAPDYDNPAFDEVGQAYRVLRDDFSVTFSPYLGRGLNLGATTLLAANAGARSLRALRPDFDLCAVLGMATFGSTGVRVDLARLSHGSMATLSAQALAPRSGPGLGGSIGTVAGGG